MPCSWSRFCSLFLLTAGLMLLAADRPCYGAQRGKGGGSGGNMPSMAPSDLIVHGTVALPGGMVPLRLVRVDHVCGGRTMNSTYADSKGRFSFNLGILDRDLKASGSNTGTSGSVTSTASMKLCSVRASIPGYHAQSISLEQVAKQERAALGELLLKPIGTPPVPLMSATDAAVPPNALKEFEKGLDLAAKSKLPDAIAAMKKAVSADKKFATAWLALGILQVSQNQTSNALESYDEAIAADDKFAAPYVEAAALEAVANQWDKVVEHTDRAISLDPDSFALAYYLNAMANIRLTKADAADKSAIAGLRVDEDHEYPDLAYMQGILLVSKGDRKNARTQFESYLALAPNGMNAANARQQLTELPAPK